MQREKKMFVRMKNIYFTLFDHFVCAKEIFIAIFTCYVHVLNVYLLYSTVICCHNRFEFDVMKPTSSLISKINSKSKNCFMPLSTYIIDWSSMFWVKLIEKKNILMDRWIAKKKLEFSMTMDYSLFLSLIFCNS